MLHRRDFLGTAAAWAAATVWADRALGVTRRNVALSGNPFACGVASGDPSADGFVIWTRLAPQPIAGGGMPDENVAVDWQVAEDEAMTKIVRSGTIAAVSQWGHTVHVEVDGLKPDRWYYYRFRAAGEISPLGRTRTFPALNVLPEKLKFAFASCQHWESGWFTAYEHMLKEHVDLVLHLGDYIYEGKPAKPTKDLAPKIRYHSGDEEITELRHYRDRHAQYKTDPALAAMHAAAPWLVVWDDHEVDNNYCAEIIEETAVNKKTTKEEFLKRRAAAYQAYYEHMPLRRVNLPKGSDMQLYRTCSFGRLAEFQMLDTRQYRSNQPNGDGTKPHTEESLASSRTMLGPAQEKWLNSALDTTQATWNVLGQQIMMGPVDRIPGEKEGFSMDQWPGSEAARRRLIKSLHDKRVSNPVVLTGDIHSNWANELWLDGDVKSPTKVATEFVCTSLSSGGNGVREAKNHDAVMAENPFVKFFNTERGYVNCVVTPKSMTADYRVVEYVDKPGAPLVNRASFTVEAGKPELRKA